MTSDDTAVLLFTSSRSLKLAACDWLVQAGSRPARSGIGGIERRLEQKNKETNQHISVAFEDLTKLMDKVVWGALVWSHWDVGGGGGGAYDP